MCKTKESKVNPLCQQCKINVGAEKTPTMRGNLFRWKCRSCLERKNPSGFPSNSGPTGYSSLTGEPADYTMKKKAKQ